MLKAKFGIVMCFICISVVFLVIPLMFILSGAFMVDGALSLGNFEEIFTNAYYYTALIKTLKLAFVSAMSGFAIATVVVMIFKVYFPEFYNRLITISNVFLNFSGVQLAFAFIILFGNSGVINILLDGIFKINIYGESGLIMVYTYFQVPFAIMLLIPVFEGIDMQLLQAGKTLKASSWYIIRKVYVPIVSKSLATIWILLFANALSAYVTPYALTGNNYGIFIVRMANLIAGDVVLNPNLASAMALVLMVILVSLLLCNRLLSRRSVRFEKTS